MSCWIWVVPSRIWKVFASRNMRSTGTSRVSPAPPSTCTASVVARIAASQQAFFAIAHVVDACRPSACLDLADRLQPERPRRRERRDDVGEEEREPLVADDRLAERLARAGVLERDLERAAGGAERAGRDVEARLVERRHREPEAVAVRAEELRRRLVEAELRGRHAAQAEEVLVAHDLEPRRAGLDEERRDARLRARPDGEDVRRPSRS